MQAGKLATYDDLLALPEGQRAEVIGGAMITPTSPLPRHGRAQRVVGRIIGGAFDDDDGLGGPGGWWILPEFDARLSPHDIVKPDIAGWRRERLPDPWDIQPDRRHPRLDLRGPIALERRRRSGAQAEALRRARPRVLLAARPLGAHARGPAPRPRITRLDRGRVVRRCLHRADRSLRRDRDRGRALLPTDPLERDRARGLILSAATRTTDVATAGGDALVDLRGELALER